MKNTARLIAASLTILLLSSALLSCGMLKDSSNKGDYIIGTGDGNFGYIIDGDGNIIVGGDGSFNGGNVIIYGPNGEIMYGNFADLSPSNLLSTMKSSSYAMNVSVKSGYEGEQNVYDTQLDKHKSLIRLGTTESGTYLEEFFDLGAHIHTYLNEYYQWVSSKGRLLDHTKIVTKAITLDASVLFDDKNYNYSAADKVYTLKSDAAAALTGGSMNAVAFVTITSDGAKYTLSCMVNNNGYVTELEAVIEFRQPAEFIVPEGIEIVGGDEKPEGGNNGNDYVNYWDLFENDEELYDEKSGLTFRLFKDGSYCVVRGDNSRTSFTIPSRFNGTLVTAIGERAFADCWNTKSFQIPDGITTIYGYAFSNVGASYIRLPESVTKMYDGIFCDSRLEGISLPSSITAIPDRTFHSCSNLRGVNIPEGITSVGESAFGNCPDLSEVVLPQSIRTIERNAFTGCNIKNFDIPKGSTAATEIAGVWYTSDVTGIVCIPKAITSLKVPATVNNITESFRNSQKLVEVTFESGSQLEWVGDSAFQNCASLTAVILPYSVTRIECFAFTDCPKLQKVSIPEGVTSIGYGAFMNCTSLDTVILPNSLTQLEQAAFEGSAIKAIHIPAALTNIAGNVFINCKDLVDLTVSDNNTKYLSIDNCLIERESKILLYSAKGVIPNDPAVNTIGHCAMSSVESFSTVVIPDNITKILNSAFEYTSHVSIVIPDSVVYIADFAFTNNTQFLYCAQSKAPASWHENWNCVDCPVVWGYKNQGIPQGKLELTKVQAENGSYHYVVSGVGTYTSRHVIIPATYGNLPVKEIAPDVFRYFPITEVTIPEGIEIIGEYAFAYTDLCNVVIPSTIYKLSGLAFSGCELLDTVTVAEGGKGLYYSSGNCVIYRDTVIFGTARSTIPTDPKVTRIAKSAFSYNQSLYKVSIPDNIKVVEPYAFSFCRNLHSVYIGGGVETIFGSAFEYCESLSEINVSSHNRVYHSNGNCIIETQSNKIVVGTTLENIPSYVKEIGTNAFCGRKGLGDIVIPEGITFIEYYAFSNCGNVNSLTLPASLKGFDATAFDRCYIERISVAARNPIYYSQDNCVIEKKTGKLVLGATASRIPDDGRVTSIGEYAFQFTEIRGTLIIPDSVKRIESYAFAYCYYLNEVYIPASVEYIGDGAFCWGNYETVIRCAASSKPDAWSDSWCEYTVTWNSARP